MVSGKKAGALKPAVESCNGKCRWPEADSRRPLQSARMEKTDGLGIDYRSLGSAVSSKSMPIASVQVGQPEWNR